MAELRPSGFPEYSPSQQLIFDKLKWIIEKNYQSFWYTHIQTPAVERNSVLLSKNW
jgi:histidyl-tRNA synthetase